MRGAPTLAARWSALVRRLKRDILTLYYAYRDPRTPWVGRVAAALLVGYAFSPLDLIPDFIPLLGLLDDAVLLPIGIYLALRLLPPEVLADARERAAAHGQNPRPLGRLGVLLVLALWAAGLLLALLWWGDR